MKGIFKITLILSAMFLIGCAPNAQQESNGRLGVISETTMNEVITKVAELHPGADRERMERGVSQAASLRTLS